MNTFNRVVVVISALVLMVVVTFVCILPETVLGQVGEWLMKWADYFGQMRYPWLRVAVGLLLAVLFDALMALLIFFELRPRRKRLIRVQQIAGGMVTINDASIVQQIEYKLDPIPGIINVKPEIQAKRDKVQAVVHVDVAAGTNVPSMAANLVDKIKSVLMEDLGLQIYGQPEVRIKVTSIPGGRLPEPVPQPKPTPVQPREAEPVLPPPLPIEKHSEWAGPTSETKEDVEA